MCSVELQSMIQLPTLFPSRIVSLPANPVNLSHVDSF
jgi:hypothetical protein